MIDINLEKIKRDMKSDLMKNFPLFDYVGKIGSFGKVVFKVGEGDTLTPEKFSTNIGSDVTKHKNLRTPPLTEFKNRKLRTVTLPIKLVYTLCNISETLETLTKMCETGEFYDLIIASKKVGSDSFRIDSVQYSYSKSDGAGNPMVVALNLNLEEYIVDINRDGSNEISMANKPNTLKEKVIQNINSEVSKALKGGRQW